MSESFPLQELLPNELEYPQEYFDAQTRFALKWAELSDMSAEDALLNNTALFRRLTDVKDRTTASENDLWTTAVGMVSEDPEHAAKIFYDLYKQQPHALYKPPEYAENDGKHFGFFSYDYYPDNPLNDGKNTVKIHFINSQRGAKSGLHPDFATERKKNLRSMFSYIHKNYPDAVEVLGGSWLYHLDGYRSNFPQEFLNSAKRLVPPGFEASFSDSVPHMSLTGNSIWGQFVDRNGYVRQETYDSFMDNLEGANSLEDLIQAFPQYPLQTRSDIDVFYKFLDV